MEALDVPRTAYVPTVNTFIEPPTIKQLSAELGEPKAETEPKAGASRLYYDPPPVCCPTSPGDILMPVSHTPSPEAMLNALGIAFGVGAFVGAMLVFAFSKPSAVVTDA